VPGGSPGAGQGRMTRSHPMPPLRGNEAWLILRLFAPHFVLPSHWPNPLRHSASSRPGITEDTEGRLSWIPGKVAGWSLCQTFPGTCPERAGAQLASQGGPGPSLASAARPAPDPTASAANGSPIRCLQLMSSALAVMPGASVTRVIASPGRPAGLMAPTSETAALYAAASAHLPQGHRPGLGKLGPSGLVGVHPSRPTARLSPMDPAIQAIPTFGTYSTYTRPGWAKPGDVPKILMSWLARLILFSPATPAIQVVGIFGRSHG